MLSILSVVLYCWSWCTTRSGFPLLLFVQVVLVRIVHYSRYFFIFLRRNSIKIIQNFKEKGWPPPPKRTPKSAHVSYSTQPITSSKLTVKFQGISLSVHQDTRGSTTESLNQWIIQNSIPPAHQLYGGGHGVETRRKEGGQGRRRRGLWERKRWEIGVLEGWKAKEIEGNYATMLKNFTMEKWTNGRKEKTVWELTMQGTGGGGGEWGGLQVMLRLRSIVVYFT